MLRDLKTLIEDYSNKHWLPEPARPDSPKPALPTSQFARFLMWYMPAVPWVLFVLFVLSLFNVDFNESTIPLRFLSFERIILLDKLLLTVSVSGLIGFATNWLAITMLFRPRKRRPILGQGFIPSRRALVIDRLAKAIENELINEDTIKHSIHESRIIPYYRERVLQLINDMTTDEEFRMSIRSLAKEYLNALLSQRRIQA